MSSNDSQSELIRYRGSEYTKEQIEGLAETLADRAIESFVKAYDPKTIRGFIMDDLEEIIRSECLETPEEITGYFMEHDEPFYAIEDEWELTPSGAHYGAPSCLERCPLCGGDSVDCKACGGRGSLIYWADLLFWRKLSDLLGKHGLRIKMNDPEDSQTTLYIIPENPVSILEGIESKVRYIGWHLSVSLRDCKKDVLRRIDFSNLDEVAKRQIGRDIYMFLVREKLIDPVNPIEFYYEH